MRFIVRSVCTVQYSVLKIVSSNAKFKIFFLGILFEGNVLKIL